MLTTLIRFPKIPPDPRFAVGDRYSSSLSTLFPNDVPTQHGDAGSYVIYKSKRFGDLELRLADPSIEDDRWLFAHSLWNHVTGKKVLELGGGTGLTGIVTGLAGAAEVAILDYPSPELLASIKLNVEKNVPEYIRDKRINQHHSIWPDQDPETTRDAQKLNAESPEISTHSSMTIHGHKWGDLTDRLSYSHAEYFTRIIAADCLWMVGEHEELIKSLLHFLSRDEDAQVWVIAGFHTGRAKLASFFDTAVEQGLEIPRIY